MKIVLITGSYPPDICGVGDYTAKLAESLVQVGLDVQVYSPKVWSALKTKTHLKNLRAMKADILHMQYPTAGYGWKLGPQLISLLHPLVVTVHECSQRKIMRKLSLYPFSFLSSKIIFTTEYEQGYAWRYAPWIKQRSKVIPIGCNIPLITTRQKVEEKCVTYFGLIEPHKGLEQVMEMTRIFQDQKCGIRTRIIGKVKPCHKKYYQHLRKDAQWLPVQWIINLDGKKLSKALSETEIAYLPFPDGASERRGSLITMLANGTLVLTTVGPHTPLDMQKSIVKANSPNEAATIVKQIYNNSKQTFTAQTQAINYVRKFTWNKIAADHVTIYQQVVCGKHVEKLTVGEK